MPVQTPICDFGKKALPFELKSTENKIISLDDIKGENGTLIMFICNHCPYVKAVTKEIVEDCNELKKIGINSVAICSNDFVNYPDDSFDNMIKFSNDNQFTFPYLHDDTQKIAKSIRKRISKTLGPHSLILISNVSILGFSLLEGFHL